MQKVNPWQARVMLGLAILGKPAGSLSVIPDLLPVILPEADQKTRNLIFIAYMKDPAFMAKDGLCPAALAEILTDYEEGIL